MSGEVYALGPFCARLPMCSTFVNFLPSQNWKNRTPHRVSRFTNPGTGKNNNFLRCIYCIRMTVLVLNLILNWYSNIWVFKNGNIFGFNIYTALFKEKTNRNWSSIDMSILYEYFMMKS